MEKSTFRLQRDEQRVNELIDLFRTGYSKIKREMNARTGSNFVAEEITAEAFEKAWEMLGSYRGDGPMKHWVSIIAHNHLKTSKRREQPYDYGLLESDGTNKLPGIEELVIQREEIRETREGLNGLLPEQKELLRLIVVEELTIGEVSQRWMISPGAVKSRLHRTREALKKKIGESQDNLTNHFSNIPRRGLEGTNV